VRQILQLGTITADEPCSIFLRLETAERLLERAARTQVEIFTQGSRAGREASRHNRCDDKVRKGGLDEPGIGLDAALLFCLLNEKRRHTTAHDEVGHHSAIPAVWRWTERHRAGDRSRPRSPALSLGSLEYFAWAMRTPSACSVAQAMDICATSVGCEVQDSLQAWTPTLVWGPA